MRKIFLSIAAAATLSAMAAGPAEAGCYRLGLTGYHHYQSCFGPRLLYPHHKYCTYRHGRRFCSYH
jgi:hypothetical protein